MLFQKKTRKSFFSLICKPVDESGVQSKDASSPSGNTKVMGKPVVPSAGPQVTSPSPIAQRLPAFLDNHNYAKSPMQVRGEVCCALALDKEGFLFARWVDLFIYLFFKQTRYVSWVCFPSSGWSR